MIKESTPGDDVRAFNDVRRLSPNPPLASNTRLPFESWSRGSQKTAGRKALVRDCASAHKHVETIYHAASERAELSVLRPRPALIYLVRKGIKSSFKANKRGAEWCPQMAERNFALHSGRTHTLPSSH